MKIQDVLFIAVLIGLLVYKQSLRSGDLKKDPKWFVVAGLGLLVLAIPLFATWTFFTAERLTWYAAAFFLLSIALFLWKGR